MSTIVKVIGQSNGLHRCELDDGQEVRLSDEEIREWRQEGAVHPFALKQLGFSEVENKAVKPKENKAGKPEDEAPKKPEPPKKSEREDLVERAKAVGINPVGKSTVDLKTEVEAAEAGS